ncbi:MAG: glycosyltransferase family 2 protein [Muribaculaceae bacterium]|nr:glycosyltransferase family 2 protein [Muribaculaceae bacterium]
MNPAVSVIIPFHDAESTLGRAIESLVGQRGDECYEFVFVNDGSNDRSVEVLNYYLALHPDFERRSILLSYPFRQGAAAAMALGLRNAGGRYVARLDADDAFADDALKRMLECAEQTDADIVYGGVTVVRPGKRDKVLNIKDTGGNLNLMPMTTRYFSLWNKFIKKSLLVENDIYPVSGIDCWDDVSVTARAYALAETVSCCDFPVYNYTVDKSKRTLSRSHKDLVLRQRLMCALLLEKWFVDKGLDEKYSQFLLNMKFHAKIKMLRGSDCNVTRWRETYPEVNKAIMSLRQMNIFLRIAFKMADILPARLVRAVCRAIS